MPATSGTKEAEAPYLAHLHVELQAAMNAIIERGERPLDVAEAMFAVAVAAKCQIAGTRETSRELYVTGVQLFQMAEQNEAQQSASRH